VLALGAESVLEAGPGDGLLAAAMVRSGLDVALCDPLPEAIRDAGATLRALGIEPTPGALVDFAEGLVGSDELRGAFDVALAVWAVQQARDPAAFVAGLAHVARRAVVLVVPCGWGDPPLDVWRFEEHRDVLDRLRLGSGAFSAVDVERLAAGPGEPGGSFLVVGRVRR
jgi:hypothetical protein